MSLHITGGVMKYIKSFIQSGYLIPSIIALAVLYIIYFNTIGETNRANELLLGKIEYASLADDVRINAKYIENGPVFNIPKSDYFEFHKLYTLKKNEYFGAVESQPSELVKRKKNFRTKNLKLAKINVFLLTSGQQFSSKIGHLSELIELEAELERRFENIDMLNVYGIKTSFTFDGLMMFGEDIYRNNGFMNQFTHLRNITEDKVPYRIRLLQPYGRPDSVYNGFQKYMQELNKLAVKPFNKMGVDRSHMYVFTDEKNRITSVVSSATHIKGKWIGERLDGDYFIPTPHKIANAILREVGLGNQISSSEGGLLPAPPLKDGKHGIVKNNIEFAEWALSTDFSGMALKATKKVQERFKEVEESF